MRVAAVLCAAVLFLGPPCFAESPVPAANPAPDAVYRIGAILPLTGSNAMFGNSIKRGLDLALRQMPASAAARLELLYEDDEWQQPKTVSAFHKLVEQRGVRAIVVCGSASGSTLSPLADRAKIPLIAVGASSAKVVKDQGYAFIHWITPEVEAARLTSEVQRLGYQRVGMVTAEQEGAVAIRTAIRDAFEKAGIANRIVLDESYLGDVTDFRTYLAKAKAKDVRAFLVCLFPGAISSFAKQSRAAGLSGPFIGVETFEDEAEVRASEGTMIGQWFVTADEGEPSFREAYRQQFAESPGWAAANSYDVLNMLARAVRERGPEGPAVREWLRNVQDYDGALGRYSASGDNRFLLPAVVKVVREHGFERAEPQL